MKLQVSGDPRALALLEFWGKNNNAPCQLTRRVVWSSAYGIRTRVADVRGRRPRPLDERATTL
jgi:hypothetical protein